MTPAINLAEKKKIAHRIHEYIHDSSASSYGLEAAEKLGVPANRVFKTLVCKADSKVLVVGIVPVINSLNFKKMAKAVGAKKTEMADSSEVERSTGYVLGGVSPLGQKKRLKTVVDSSALEHQTIFVSAGKRGVEIELSPKDLQQLTSAEFSEVAQ